MKRILVILTAVAILIGCALIISADDKGTPIGCGAPASTTPSDWAKQEIEKGFEIGLLDSKTTYFYGTPITRKEFCEILYKAVKEKTDTIDGIIETKAMIHTPVAGITVTDCDSEAVYELIRTGIISGKSTKHEYEPIPYEPSYDVLRNIYNVTFAPDDFLTRQEAATIISRAVSLFDNISYTEMYYEYDDEESISDWAKNSVQIMSNLGIMRGTGNEIFSPNAIFWTEEALVTIIRFADLANNKSGQISEIELFADKINAQMPSYKNYMFSPLSVKMALALAANGADGQTKEQIVKAIGAQDLDSFNQFSKDLIESYSKTDKLQINIANSVWVNKDQNRSPYDFNSQYAKTVENFYGASAEEVDNSNAVNKINSWVNEKTAGKIPSIINDNDFWAALINAIYFKGAWEDDFTPHATYPETFFFADGSQSMIDFMHKTDYMPYAKTENAEVISLDFNNYFESIDKDGNLITESYRDLDAKMFFIMCDNDTNVEELIKNASFTSTRVALSLPKFKIEYSTEMTSILHNLKITDAFDENTADFSKMMDLSPQDRLWIDKVLHKTYIEVEETGVEAAAVTAVMMGGATSAMPKEPIPLKFDEPFYFVIRVNGETLFMGRYAYQN